MVTDVGADRRHPFPFVSVTAGVLWAVCCVVLTYRAFLALGGGALGAVIGTIVVTGLPVVFLAVRLAIFLNAHERQEPVTFWPGDRSSTIANWGLVLLILYLVLVSFMAAFALDQIFLGGQIGRFLSDVSE